MIHSQRKQDLAGPDQFTTVENVKTWILDNFDWPFLFNPWHILVLWLKMFIWFSLKREAENFYWFSPCYKSQFLQTLIPVDALYEHSKKGGAWTKERNSPSEIIPASKPTFTGNHLKYSPPLLIMWGKVTPMGDTAKSWIARSSFIFSSLMKHAGSSLGGMGRLREFQWIKKRQLVPDSSIPSAAYLEPSLLPALTHSPLCLQCWCQGGMGHGGMLSRKWDRIESSLHSKLACLS